MAGKRAVPPIPLGEMHKSVSIIKENLDMLTGRTTGELKPLPTTASLADCITAINLIIARLNGSTN
jgi:hypothetical protein